MIEAHEHGSHATMRIGESVATRLGPKDKLPRLIEYRGAIMCDGLFRLHDERGLPLVVMLDECRKRGWKPCLQQFVADAIKAGWPRERAERVIAEAQADQIGEEVKP